MKELKLAIFDMDGLLLDTERWSLNAFRQIGKEMGYVLNEAELRKGMGRKIHKDADLKKILQFIPAAVERGYKLVTLNEMFGLPSNETGDLTQKAPKKDLEAFKVIPIKMEKTLYLRSAAVIQERLIELGWLEGQGDGVFGDGSFKATGFFQMASGIHATGVADVNTQKAMFAPDAKRGTPELIEEYTAQVRAKMQKK